VSCGVFFEGVDGPNAAIELGKKKAAPCSRAASSAAHVPFTFTSHENIGSASPRAERIPARWSTVSAPNEPSVSENAFG